MKIQIRLLFLLVIFSFYTIYVFGGHGGGSLLDFVFTRPFMSEQSLILLLPAIFAVFSLLINQKKWPLVLELIAFVSAVAFLAYLLSDNDGNFTMAGFIAWSVLYWIIRILTHFRIFLVRSNFPELDGVLTLQALCTVWYFIMLGVILSLIPENPYSINKEYLYFTIGAAVVSISLLILILFQPKIAALVLSLMLGAAVAFRIIPFFVMGQAVFADLPLASLLTLFVEPLLLGAVSCITIVRVLKAKGLARLKTAG